MDTGAIVNVAGVAMPGKFLPQRIRQILGGVAAPKISQARRACTIAACTLSSAVFAAGLLEPAALPQAQQSSKFVIDPLQPTWVPDSFPQPVSLPFVEGDEWTFEVKPIISSEELTAYSQLQNVLQRDAFISQFWSQRDPSPGTPEMNSGRITIGAFSMQRSILPMPRGPVFLASTRIAGVCM